MESPVDPVTPVCPVASALPKIDEALVKAAHEKLAVQKKQAAGSKLCRDAMATYGNSKKHMFCLSFNHIADGRVHAASAYVGMHKKAVDIAAVDDGKKQAKIPADSVLISVSYMGLHKIKDFFGL